MIRTSKSRVTLSHRYRKLIRSLIWTYFFLLVFEGFLRMVIPPLSTPLLVVRDPFLLLTYVVACMAYVFPWNRYMVLFLGLGLVAFALGFFVLPSAPTVLLYGFRCSFLHVPLIFIIPRVMDEGDIAAIGKWFLILALPIAILMCIQFAVGPEHWLNRGLDNQFRQIGASDTKIRPPGTFTAVTGPVHYFSYVVAFLLYGQFSPNAFSSRLTVLASIAACVGIAVSICRSALFEVAMVILTAAVGIGLARPQQSIRFVRFAALGAIAFFVASQLPIFQESQSIFANRIEGANVSEGGTAGIAMRFLSGFMPFETMAVAPLEGMGLGRGTNAGAVLYAGKLLSMAENEWSRVVFELGAIMGGVYILMRISLCFNVIRASYVAAKLGQFLPMLLLGSTWMNLIVGGWQQTTVLGFTALGGDMCLAACNPKGSSRVGEIAG